MERIRNFIRNEKVASISVILAAVSVFIVPPDREYAEYIHWSTLSILLCLMLITSGLRAIGVFDAIGHALLRRASNARSISFILVGLCFFLSPFITNDVALITFVPFAIFLLGLAGLEEYLIPVLVLQTIAAHMGSMLSPVGNPHNLYLYELSGISSAKFVFSMLPFFLLAGVLLTLSILFVTRRNRSIDTGREAISRKGIPGRKRYLIIMYLVLFAVSLLVILKVMPYYAALAIIVAAVFVFDRNNFRNPDYCLLLTFACLFIFVGNIGRIEAIEEFLGSIVSGHEIITSVLASQVISNVPASILLPEFSSEYMLIAIGTDIGGMGTVIASMANLISLKQYTTLPGSSLGRYLLQFTVINVIFLIPMTAFAYLIL